jgi:uncharacterized protein (DUF2062 family)
MTMLNNPSNPGSISSGAGSSFESLTAFCQNIQSEARLQQYRIEQQQQEIRSLKEKVEILELHKATQLGQDKIVGFMVGAIVLSLLSLITSIFFSPSENPQFSWRLQEVQQNIHFLG